MQLKKTNEDRLCSILNEKLRKQTCFSLATTLSGSSLELGKILMEPPSTSKRRPGEEEGPGLGLM